mmetsp:Transcript_15353/g.15228  ORF Transcript_15353/g.15228 Transcript_15353/m.15228 type:complete len:90 (-) Transcript_15353:115-384(-)
MEHKYKTYYRRHRRKRILEAEKKRAEKKRKRKLIKRYQEGKKAQKIAEKVVQMIQPYMIQNPALAPQIAMEATQSYINEDFKDSDDSDY